MVTANAGIGFTKRPLLNVEFVRAAYFAVACPRRGVDLTALKTLQVPMILDGDQAAPDDVFKDVTAVCGPPTNNSQH